MVRVRGTLLVCLMLWLAPAALAQTPDPASAEDHERIRKLEAQVRALTERLSAVPPAATASVPAPSLPPAAPATPSPPAASRTPATSSPPAAASHRRLDVSKPPFGEFDFSWLNGNNPQPSSMLTVGPLTWTIYIDAYYAFQFHQPIDHTIFPTTTAARHNEISFNLGILGVDVTGLDGPLGRIYIQYGSNVETDAGPGSDGQPRLLPLVERLQVHRAGRGRLALPRTPSGSTRRSASSPRTSGSRATCRKKTGPTPTPSSPTPRPIISSASARRSFQPSGSRSSCGWSMAGRPSANGTRGARAAISSTGGPAGGSRW